MSSSEEAGCEMSSLTGETSGLKHPSRSDRSGRFVCAGSSGVQKHTDSFKAAYFLGPAF